MGGTPAFIESQALPDVSYARFAESVGLQAIVVTEPEDLADAWRTALSAERPCVLDIHCDPDVPPIPPHADLEQMLDTAKALLKGDSSRWGVIKEGVKTKAQELLPHRDD
jgi:pyruvate dehydrogenase (quinone)